MGPGWQLLSIGWIGFLNMQFGWFANVSVVVNLVLLVAMMSLGQFTLTLPGMAGILLTLGMAVDANILVNERIREEQKSGRPPLAAREARRIGAAMQALPRQQEGTE